MRNLKYILLMLACTFLWGCGGTQAKTEKINVSVSIPPLKGIVSQIAGEKLEIITVIPSGFSPANYQPSPKEMEKITSSNVYFAVGVPAENEILKDIKGMNGKIQVIDLGEEPAHEYGARHFKEEEHKEHEEDHEDEHEHSHDGMDPHQWMSPKRVMLMAEIIERKLSSMDTENSETYKNNLKKFKEKLEDLDKRLKEASQKKENKAFLIYHPSLGYIAKDYGFEMIAIEQGGKEATPKALTEIIDRAKENNIKVIFYQAEMDSRQAEIIADEIGGKTLKINPLEEDYIKNIEDIIKALEM